MRGSELAKTSDALYWLARRRSPTEIAGEQAEHLSTALGVEPTPTAISQALDTILGSLPQDEYGNAARDLLGSYEYRWGPLNKRQAYAAGHFDISVDGFRKGRADGTSRETDTYDFIASAIEAARPEPGPTSDSEHSNSRFKLVASGLTIAAVVLAAVAMAFTSDTEPAAAPPAAPITVPPTTVPSTTTEPSTTSPTTEPPVTEPPPSTVEPQPCPFQAGDVAAELPVELAQPATAAIIHEAEVWGAIAARCAITQATVLGPGPLVFQEFGEPGETPHSVVVVQDDTALTLPYAAWGSYRQIGGKSGDNAYLMAGQPLGLTETTAATYFDLDGDVVLVAETRDAPYFFVLGVTVTEWNTRGGAEGPLGLPTSNPHLVNGAFRQHFQTGYLELSDTTGLQEYIEIDDPAAELPDADVMAENLLRQSDGTAWFITADLERKWIPDGLTYSCLVGDPEFAAIDVPGYALATLDYGGLASCDDAV